MDRQSYNAAQVISPSCENSDIHKNAAQGLSRDTLKQQNRQFADSGGVSRNNRCAGFVPGYLNTQSGIAVLSCFANGNPAPIHLLEGLPSEWVSERDQAGMPVCTIPEVIAGFIRDGHFYSREEAARILAAHQVEAVAGP